MLVGEFARCPVLESPVRTTLTVQLGYLMLICSTVFLLSSDRIVLERRDEIKDEVRCRMDDLNG